MDWQLDGYVDRSTLIGYMTSSKRNSSLLEYSDDRSEFPAVEYQKLPISPSAVLPEQGRARRKWDEHEDGTKRSLLRTLQLSQTRAREAEKKAKFADMKLEKMSRVLFEEYMKLYAHQQWIMLLEIEVTILQDRLKMGRDELVDHQAAEESSTSSGVPIKASWCWTFAFCIGVAGVSFVMSHYIL